MEDNFDQNEFEDFLRGQVRNHRMYPTDAVWRNINKELHGEKKWPALTIAAFALLSATIAICVYFNPQPDVVASKIIKQTNSPIESKTSTLLSSKNNSSSNQGTRFSASKTVARNKGAAATASLRTGLSRLSGQRITGEVASGKRVKDLATVPPGLTRNEAKHLTPGSLSVSEPATTIDLSLLPNNGIDPQEKLKPKPDGGQPKEFDDKNMVDDFLKEHKEDIALYTISKPDRPKNKFSFQLYVAPSISYRKLFEDRAVLKNGVVDGPVGLNYVADVNNVVRHRPGRGLEAGVGIMYNLSDKFRIKSGLQFNVRQYRIEAYRSGYELASIALIDNNRIDTVTTYAVYRTRNGYSSAELVNRYYQFSVPVGVEWEVLGNKKIQLNIGASIQPTYLVNRNAYILSTNFKNYSEKPDIVRSFNINSNIETFVSFKAGYFKWQIGPQVRYQPYSTFIKQYPIKEHLLDYGIKIGVSKMFNKY